MYGLFKLLGAVLVITAGGLMGLSVAQQYHKRPKQLQELQTALHMLDTEIGYASTPLPEAVTKVSRCVSSPIANFFSDLARLLKTRQGYTATEAWQEAMKKMPVESVLSPADLEILGVFGHTLGGTDKDEQRKSIQLTCQQLKQQQQQAEEERVKNEPLWRYAGFLLSVLLVILIY